jgi:hypothetical protein
MCQPGGQAEHENYAEYNKRKDKQDCPDYSADFSGLSGAATGGIHRAGVDFLQIAGAHDPGCNAQRTANDQAKNAENENECAAMWFHGL